MTDRKRRSFGTMEDTGAPPLRDLTIGREAPEPGPEPAEAEARASGSEPKSRRPAARRGKAYRVVALSLPLSTDEAVTTRAKAEEVGRGRIVWMAYERHKDQAADTVVPSQRRVLTRVYLHEPEIEAIDELADGLGVSRSHAVAALLEAALS